MLLSFFLLIIFFPSLHVILGSARSRMAMLVGTRALGKPDAVTRGPPLEEVHRGHSCPAHGVFGNGVGNGLGVDKERIQGQVVNRVAGFVVVLVVGDTGYTTEESNLRFRLGDFGTREETTRGDAVFDKGSVVGAAAKLGRDGGQALASEELLKVLFDCIGASGTREVEGVAVTIVDTENVVGAGNLSDKKNVRLA